MNAVPVRRSLASLLLGVLAMGGSFAAVGTVVLADVASAEEPVEAPPPAQVQVPPYVEPGSRPPPVKAPPPVKKKQRVRKVSKMDMGRFEGY